VYLLRQRYSHYSRQFLPHIRLAIRPILREILQRDLQIFMARQLESTSLSGSNPVSQWRRDSIASNPTIDANSMQQVSHQGRFINSATGFELRPPAVSEPLQLVFRRHAQVFKATEIHRRSARVSAWEESLFQRTALHRKRTEENIVEVCPLVLRHALAAANNSPQAIPASQKVSPEMFNSQLDSSVPAATAYPRFNIDQLTEQVVQQIDRRVIAWRERMGRPN
jgi:hypothetical protein